MHDTVYCNGLALTAAIGFHPAELDVKQTVVVDLALECDFEVGPARDERVGLVDYHRLVCHLERHVADRRYALIEAMAVDIARQVIRLFPAVRARVRVTKHPLQMPQVGSVAAECVRSAEHFGDE